MPYIETKEGRLFFSDHRKREDYPSLILIHGAGGSRLDWPKELRRLERANALVLDLPGHGKSPGPGRKTIEAYTQVVLAFMDALELPAAYLMGHSMGGAIVLTAALIKPDRVSGLVAIGTGAILRVNPALLEGILHDQSGTAQLLAKWFWNRQISDDVRQMTVEANTTIDAETLYHDYLACNDYDIRHRLGEIRAPALVIAGSEDRMTPPELGNELLANLPDAALVMVEGGGHMMALEYPQVVTNAVDSWLKRQMSEGD